MTDEKVPWHLLPIPVFEDSYELTPADSQGGRVTMVYEWAVFKADWTATLADSLNTAESHGWEIFAVDGAGPGPPWWTIVCRRKIPQEEE